MGHPDPKKSAVGQLNLDNGCTDVFPHSEVVTLSAVWFKFGY